MTQLSGWSFPGSPFHDGEQQVQQRLGVRDRMEAVGRRVLRNFMPDQHREFFGGLPFLVLATVDLAGRPSLSVVTGAPGFLSTPDATTLHVAAPPAGAHLRGGDDIGILGIDFATRRRNRANGLIARLAAESFDIAVKQSFGNCPRYIQAREWLAVPASPGPLRRAATLGTGEQALVAGADTFFIASALGSLHDKPSQGVDASHRGGPPGFVRVNDERTLTVPDFNGNSYYNTLGNLALNPRSGLLFLDFTEGTTLHIAAEAEILWEGPEVQRFAGAERVVRFHVTECVTGPQALALRWRFREYSPFLGALGSWGGAKEYAALVLLRCVTPLSSS